MKISIPKSIFIPITLIPSVIILLCHPSGFDIFHYYFHFNDLTSILEQPGYRIFDIFLPRYLLLPFIIYLFSFFGLIPIFIVFVFLYSYFLSRIYSLSSNLNIFYASIACLLSIGALLFGNAGTFGFLSILIIVLDYFFYPQNIFSFRHKIDLLFAFISVTNLPIIIILPILSRYKKFRNSLIIWIASISLFLCFLGVFVDWYQKNISQIEFPEGFLNRRTFSFISDLPLDEFIEVFLEEKSVVLVRFGVFLILCIVVLISTKLKSVYFKGLGNIKGLNSKLVAKGIILFLPLILFTFVNVKDTKSPTIFKLGYDYVFSKNNNVQREICFEHLITPSLLNKDDKWSYINNLSIRELCY